MSGCVVGWDWKNRKAGRSQRILKVRFDLREQKIVLEGFAMRMDLTIRWSQMKGGDKGRSPVNEALSEYLSNSHSTNTIDYPNSSRSK